VRRPAEGVVVRKLYQRRVLWVLLSLLLGALSCARPEIFPLCPGAGSGSFVISELRGRQLGNDTYGEWIEIHNTSTSVIELAGLTLRMTKLDGSAEVRIVVRDRDLVIESEGYTVLGRFEADTLPAHVDYGYVSDFGSDLYNGAVLELLACGEQMDQMVYRSLPDNGSWAFDGDQSLSAASNDDEAAWCVDDTDTAPGDGGTVTDVGRPGTPGAGNRPCA